MSFYAILALALALSADAFSISLGLGMIGVTRRQIVQLSVAVMVFHIFMPVIGYLVGNFFGALVGRPAGILGGVIIVFLGLRMVWAGLSGKEEKFSQFVLTSAYGTVVMAATVSLDALSVGFSLGTQNVRLGLAAAVIGIVAGATTFIGLGFGQKLGEWIGCRAVTFGGIILVYIGGTILV